MYFEQFSINHNKSHINNCFPKNVKMNLITHCHIERKYNKKTQKTIHTQLASSAQEVSWSILFEPLEKWKCNKLIHKKYTRVVIGQFQKLHPLYWRILLNKKCIILFNLSLNNFMGHITFTPFYIASWLYIFLRHTEKDPRK